MTYPNQNCVDECTSCLAICSYCASECLQQMEGMENCIRRCLECVETCTVMAKLGAANSPYIGSVANACAEICEACAEECEQHDNDHCKACAEACRRCARECRRISDRKQPMAA